MRAATAAKTGQRRGMMGSKNNNAKGDKKDVPITPLPAEAPTTSIGSKSPYLHRVAERSEQVIERRMLAELDEMEQRRRLGLEPTTRKMLDPLAGNPTEELLASLERGKKDIVVSIPTKNEVRVYRRARTDVKAVLRSLESVSMDMELFHAAAKHTGIARHSSPHPTSNPSSPSGGAAANSSHATEDSPEAVSKPTIPRGLDPSFRFNVTLPATYVPKPCDINSALALQNTDLQGAVSRENFQLWITERQLVPPVDPNAGRGRRRRIRHHRRSCKYNLYSTNREFRQLSLQVTFPSKALRSSAAMLRQAIHGGSNGFAEETFDVNEFFVPMTKNWWDEEHDDPHGQSQALFDQHGTPPQVHHGSAVLGAKRGSSNPLSSDSPAMTGRVQYASVVQSSPGSQRPVDEDVRSVNTNAIEDLPVAVEFDMQPTEDSGSAALFQPSPGSEAVPYSFAYSSAQAFLTEANATAPSRPVSRMSERCRTPNLATLARNGDRPHIDRKGEFWDCDCTDRSTDDELDVVRDTYVDEAAACADARLDCWRRGFAKTKVLTRARLASRLEERECDRQAVCSTRRHFAPITHEAEVAGEEWRINRQARSSTPSGASMWHASYEGVCVDTTALLAARNAYVALCDECFKIQFPATEVDERLAEMVRRRFISRYRDAIIITPAFVKEFVTSRAADIMATKVSTRFMDVLRLQAKVPVAEFLQLITELSTKLRRQADLKRVGTANNSTYTGSSGPVCSEVDTLIRRLTKQLANIHSQHAANANAGIRRPSEHVGSA